MTVSTGWKRSWAHDVLTKCTPQSYVILTWSATCNESTVTAAPLSYCTHIYTTYDYLLDFGQWIFQAERQEQANSAVTMTSKLTDKTEVSSPSTLTYTVGPPTSTERFFTGKQLWDDLHKTLQQLASSAVLIAQVVSQWSLAVAARVQL
jgi:hypothetical protein